MGAMYYVAGTLHTALLVNQRGVAYVSTVLLDILSHSTAPHCALPFCIKRTEM